MRCHVTPCGLSVMSRAATTHHAGAIRQHDVIEIDTAPQHPRLDIVAVAEI